MVPGFLLDTLSVYTLPVAPMPDTAKTKNKTARHSLDKDGNAVVVLPGGTSYTFRKPTLGDLDTIEERLDGKQLQIRSTLVACEVLSTDGLTADTLRAMDAAEGLEVTKAIESFPVFSN